MSHPNRCRTCRDEGIPSRQELRARQADRDIAEALLERAERPDPYRFTREYELEQRNAAHLRSLDEASGTGA